MADTLSVEQHDTFAPEFTESEAHANLGRFCIDYLNQAPRLEDLLPVKGVRHDGWTLDSDPCSFGDYALRNWPAHLQCVTGSSPDYTRELHAALDKLLAGDRPYLLYSEGFTWTNGTSALVTEGFLDHTTPPTYLKGNDWGAHPRLTLATYHGLFTYVKDVLQRPDITLPPAGFLPFWAGHGNLAMVDLLVEHGAELKETDGYGLTALHNATIQNHRPVMRRLLEAGADPFDPTGPCTLMHDDGFGPCVVLELACNHGKLDALGVLLDHMKTAEQINKALIYAVRSACDPYRLNQTGVVRRVLQHENPKADVNTIGAHDTPLVMACVHRRYRIVDILLDHHADPNILHSSTGNMFHPFGSGGHDRDFWCKDGKGDTALHALVNGLYSRGEKDDTMQLQRTIQKLVDAGAQVDQLDVHGQKPSDLTSHPGILQALMKAGAKLTPSQQDDASKWDPPAQEGTEHTFSDIDTSDDGFNFEFDREAFRLKPTTPGEVKTMPSDLESPSQKLQWLLREGELSKARDVVKLDVSTVNDRGQGFLHLGCARMDKSYYPPVFPYLKGIFPRLLQLGIDVNLSDAEEGDTPLHQLLHGAGQAPEYRLPEFIELASMLINAGGDMTKVNKSGETPLCKYVKHKSDTFGRSGWTQPSLHITSKIREDDPQVPGGYTLLEACVASADPHSFQLLMCLGADPNAFEYCGARNTLWHLAALHSRDQNHYQSHGTQKKTMPMLDLLTHSSFTSCRSCHCDSRHCPSNTYHTSQQCIQKLNSEGRSPLHLAAGSSPCTTSPPPRLEGMSRGRTGSQFIESSIDVLEYFLDKQYSNSSNQTLPVDDQLMTPLHIACACPPSTLSERRVAMLLDYITRSKENAFMCDVNGSTSLHYAAMAANENVVLMLLHHLVKTTNDNDDDAASVASTINHRDRENKTPTYYLARLGRGTESIRRMVELGGRDCLSSGGCMSYDNITSNYEASCWEAVANWERMTQRQTCPSFRYRSGDDGGGDVWSRFFPPDDADNHSPLPAIETEDERVLVGVDLEGLIGLLREAEEKREHEIDVERRLRSWVLVAEGGEEGTSNRGEQEDEEQVPRPWVSLVHDAINDAAESGFAVTVDCLVRVGLRGVPYVPNRRAAWCLDRRDEMRRLILGKGEIVESQDDMISKVREIWGIGIDDAGEDYCLAGRFDSGWWMAKLREEVMVQGEQYDAQNHAAIIVAALGLEWGLVRHFQPSKWIIKMDEHQACLRFSRNRVKSLGLLAGGGYHWFLQEALAKKTLVKWSSPTKEGLRICDLEYMIEQACKSVTPNMDMLKFLVGLAQDMCVATTTDGFAAAPCGVLGAGLNVLINGTHWWQLHDAFTWFISQYPDINYRDNKGDLLLFRTLKRDDWHAESVMTLVEILLDMGADPNLAYSIQTPSEPWGTAIHYTRNNPHQSDLMGADTECLRVMLELGANPNTRDSRGFYLGQWRKSKQYPLHHAAISDECADRVELLLDHGADPMAMYEAPEGTEDVQATCPFDQEYDAPCQTGKIPRTTVMHLVLSYHWPWHSLACISRLLTPNPAHRPLDLEARDSSGATLLLRACTPAGKTRKVFANVYAYTDLEPADDQEQQERDQQQDPVVQLLHLGADPQAVDNKGRNCFHYLHATRLTAARRLIAALKTPSSRDLRKLLNKRDSDGNTPLLLAIPKDGSVDRDHYEGSSSYLSHLLLDAGADPSIANSKGETAVHRAFGAGCTGWQEGTRCTGSPWRIRGRWVSGTAGKEAGEVEVIERVEAPLGGLLEKMMRRGGAVDVNVQSAKGETPVFTLFREGKVVVDYAFDEPEGPPASMESKAFARREERARAAEVEKDLTRALFRYLGEDLGVDFGAVTKDGSTLLHVLTGRRNGYDHWSPSRNGVVQERVYWWPRYLVEDEDIDPRYTDKKGRSAVDWAAANDIVPGKVMKLLKGIKEAIT